MKNKVIGFLFVILTISTFAQKKKSSIQKKPIAKTAVSKTAITPKEGIFAELETSKGKIVLVLEHKKTPITVANFVSLAEGKNTNITDEKLKGKPFFDGLKFHRVIKDFMIQGGDPQGTGQGGPGYSFKDEFYPTLVHDKGGILSMANSGPGTNGSQFFITHKETSWLNNKHSIFGHVISGMEVVNAIAQDDIIKTVKIIRKGTEAKNFIAEKIFANYYVNKAEDDKKQAALREEAKKKQQAEAEVAKKIYMEKYKSVITAKAAELSKLKSTATKSATGLETANLKKGTKKPEKDSTIYFYYAGYFEDGTLFDSNFEEVAVAYGKFDDNRKKQSGYDPFPFKVGTQAGMIPGFLEALNEMSIDEKSIVYIPANLAYGEKGAGNVIPPNSSLIFEIQVVEKAPEKK
jgi:peptidyl-prolyl cis-trans isomerase A (cyclophilin A)